ncbi:MAG: hypothetical protein AAF281_08250 [Pseudomonadota bacterium]
MTRPDLAETPPFNALVTVAARAVLAVPNERAPGYIGLGPPESPPRPPPTVP